MGPEERDLKDGEVCKDQLAKKVNKDLQEHKASVDQKDLSDQSDCKDHQAEMDQKELVAKLVHLDQTEPQDILEREVDPVSLVFQDPTEHEDHQDHQDQPQTPSVVNTLQECCLLFEKNSLKKVPQKNVSPWVTSN